MLTHTAKHGITIWRDPLAPTLIANLQQFSGTAQRGRGYLEREEQVIYLNLWNPLTLWAGGLPYSARLDLSTPPFYIEYRLPKLTVLALIIAALILFPTLICLPIMFIGIAINHLVETNSLKKFLREQFQGEKDV